MKIVILDGYTVNPGDLSWSELESLGEITVFDRTSQDQVYERSKDADIIITSKVVFNKDMLNSLSNLKYIGVIATGYNVIDIETAKEKNIVVTNVPKYCNESVAQMTFALLFELARRVGHHHNKSIEGKWSKQKDFCFWDYSQIELNDKILGIIGFGNIGKGVSDIARAVGMKVIAHDKHETKSDEVKFCNLTDLLKESDVITLHCPLTPETQNLINKESISLMKKSAFLINTSRGPLIDEAALADALNRGDIAGAGLDVLAKEPPCENNPLFSSKNCIITPHIAWSSFEARKRLITKTFENVKAFLDKNPINVVNP